jgi:hypothetical protein
MWRRVCRLAAREWSSLLLLQFSSARPELVPTPGASPYTINERNRDFSSTENKLMNSGGKIFVKGKEPQFPVLPPTVQGVTVTFR